MRPADSEQAATLKREIEWIKTLDVDGLGLQWRNAFGKRAPKSLPKALLVKVMVYRLQADALGDLDPNVARVLEGYAARDKKGRAGDDEDAKSSTLAASAGLAIKPGSVLVREWGGRSHRVMALETGFAWEGRTYRSLSEVARTITGTRWNGRRFFGVERKPEQSRSASDGQDAPISRSRSGAPGRAQP